MISLFLCLLEVGDLLILKYKVILKYIVGKQSKLKQKNCLYLNNVFGFNIYVRVRIRKLENLKKKCFIYNNFVL